MAVCRALERNKTYVVETLRSDDGLSSEIERVVFGDPSKQTNFL